MRFFLFVALAGLLAAQDNMVLVPAGDFEMGRHKLTRDDSTKMRPIVLLDDRPVHKVTLDAFWMDKTEVTNAAYAKFLAASGRKAPYHWTGGTVPQGQEAFPVYSVDWDEANAYCESEGKQLPTEAQWERAARGGKEGLNYPWGDKIDTKMARYGTAAGPGPVGQFPASEFGLFDMSGSVSEWCRDWFEREYYKSSPAANPEGPEAGVYKVIRGGAWSDSGPRVTVFFRNWVRPSQKTPNLGFRCVKPAR
jgi:formylglycine-generating enzyme required for sulfatase activity